MTSPLDRPLDGLSKLAGSKLGARLFAALGFGLLAGATLMSAIFIGFANMESRKHMVEQLVFSSKLTSSIATTSLLFKDKPKAEALLAAHHRAAGAGLVCLYDDTGRIFSTFKKPDFFRSCPAKPPKPGLTVSGAEAAYSVLIQVEDVTIGSLLLIETVQPELDRLSGLLWLGLGLVVLAIAAGLPLINRIQRRVLAPLVSLTGLMNRVSQTRDYSLRAEPQTEDEVAALVHGFNAMLGEIAEQQSALLQHQATLEQEVAKRTDALISLNEELREKSQAALSANEAKTRFLADMSHELRTPLNAIMGFAQLLELEPTLTPQQREDVKLIVSNARHLTRLFGELIEMARMETGRIEVHQHPFHPAALLCEIQNTFMAQARAKNLTLRLSGESLLPPTLLGDADKIRQIIINLVSNAIRYTHRGEVRIMTDYVGGAWEVRVEDTGIGVDPANAGRIFEAFVTADTTPGHEGTGLGLAISRRLALIMAGDLVLQWSLLGEGSAFLFRVPLVAPSPLQPERSSMATNV